MEQKIELEVGSCFTNYGSKKIQMYVVFEDGSAKLVKKASSGKWNKQRY